MARQAVEQRRGMVIVCGGDGTINEVVNGIAGSQVPLALLPAGTANILAKELGIPWDIPQAARLIPGGMVRRIALGLARNPERSPHRKPSARRPVFPLRRGRRSRWRDRQRRRRRTQEARRHHRLLDRRRPAVFQLQLPGDENSLRREGTARDVRGCRPHRELWRPVQDHHRREPVRRFLRDSHQLEAQPLRLSRVPARALASASCAA